MTKYYTYGIIIRKELVKISYYSLHNHSDYSSLRLIDSINKVSDLIQYAFDLGLKGVALTDHECISGYISALNYIEKKRTNEKASEEEKEAWKQFKLILGNEIYLCRNGLTLENFDSKKDYFYHFILLAKNLRGNEQIRELSSRAFEHSFIKNNMVRVPTYYRDLKEIIGKEPGNVIGSTACLGSFLDKTLLQMMDKPNNLEAWNTAKEWIGFIHEIFGEGNFFLELQPSKSKEQVFVNEKLIQLSKELNIPAIISTDSHFSRLEDRPIHKSFLNSKDGEREVDDFYASAYMMDAEEIHGYMDEFLSAEIVDECLNNTLLIGEAIEEYTLNNPLTIPYLPPEEEKEWAKTSIYPEMKVKNLFMNEYWEKFMHSEHAPDRVMMKRLIDRMNSDPALFYTQERFDRMNIELKTLWDSSEKQNARWSAYSLQVADYVDLAWNEGDSLVAPGRGSAVGLI